MKVFEVNGNLYEDSAFNRRLAENAKADERAKIIAMLDSADDSENAMYLLRKYLIAETLKDKNNE